MVSALGHPTVYFEGPRHAPPSEGMVRAGYLRGIRQLIRQRNGNPERLFEAAGLDPAVVDDPHGNIGCFETVMLLEHCSAMLHDPLFGLHLADAQEPDVFGCAIALARAAPDFGTALQSFIDYVPLSNSPEGVFQLREGQRAVELRWSTEVSHADYEQINQQCVVLVAKLLNALGGGRLKPYSASLEVGMEAGRIEALEQRLGFRVYTRSGLNAVAFPRAALETPLPTADPIVHELLGAYLREMRNVAADSLVEAIEAYVRDALPDGACSLQGCAARLGLSMRTLHKRLQRRGIRFSDVVEQIRLKLAKTALQGDAMRLHEIAFHAGYADQSSFGRAFKKSTGLTPRAYRQAARR